MFAASASKFVGSDAIRVLYDHVSHWLAQRYEHRVVTSEAAGDAVVQSSSLKSAAEMGGLVATLLGQVSGSMELARSSVIPSRNHANEQPMQLADPDQTD